MLQRFSKTVDTISTYAGNLSAAMIMAIALMIFYEIVARSFFNSPTSWTLEISVELTIAATFLGVAYVGTKDKHISIDLVTSRLSRQSQKVLDFTVYLLSIALMALFTYSAVKMIQMSMTTKALSPALQLPAFIPQCAVLAGAVLLILHLIQRTIVKGYSLRDGETASGLPATTARPGVAARPVQPIIVLLVFFAGIAVGLLLLKSGGLASSLGVVVLISVFLFSGMPIFLGLGAIASIGLFFLSPGLHSQLSLALGGYAALQKFELVAIPLFILGGGLIGTTRFVDRVFDLILACTARVPGSLAVASVISCAIFAAMCGSGIACALTIGLIAIPAMIARGYDKKLAIGCVASAGTLGILIPPSIAFLVFAALTGVSAGKLFMGGVLPGVLITGLLCGYVVIRCWRDPKYRSSVTYPPGERLRLAGRAAPLLVVPIVLLGSIYTGVATPTEAATVLVVAALILGFAYRKINFANLWQDLRDSLVVSSALLMIFVTACVLTVLTTKLRVTETVILLTVESGLAPWALIVVINLIIMLLGMIFESGALNMVLTPILFPLVVSLGYDPIWWGVLFVINIEIAQISPPVGIVSFALQAATGEKMELVMRSVLPFCVILALGLLIVGLLPQLATWLPSQMMR